MNTLPAVSVPSESRAVVASAMQTGEARGGNRCSFKPYSKKMGSPAAAGIPTSNTATIPEGKRIVTSLPLVNIGLREEHPKSQRTAPAQWMSMLRLAHDTGNNLICWRRSGGAALSQSETGHPYRQTLDMRRQIAAASTHNAECARVCKQSSDRREGSKGNWRTRCCVTEARQAPQPITHQSRGSAARVKCRRNERVIRSGELWHPQPKPPFARVSRYVRPLAALKRDMSRRKIAPKCRAPQFSNPCKH
jgi:hypothetical protein